MLLYDRYKFLDKKFVGTAVKSVAAKVSADQFIMSPVLLAAFYTCECLFLIYKTYNINILPLLLVNLAKFLSNFYVCQVLIQNIPGLNPFVL